MRGGDRLQPQPCACVIDPSQLGSLLGRMPSCTLPTGNEGSSKSEEGSGDRSYQTGQGHPRLDGFSSRRRNRDSIHDVEAHENGWNERR